MSDTGRLPGVPPNHLIGRARLESLYAGRSSRETVEALWQSERSRRLLLLKLVIDALTDRPGALGPLSPVEEAVAALEAAEAADRAAFRHLLLLPPVGSWAAYTLRRLHGFTTSATPVWVDAGHLHVIALVAARLTGLDLRVTVPLREGRVMLPGDGMVTFPRAAPWDVAEASVTAGHVSVRHDGQPPERWLPLRRVRCGREPTLSVALDDIDPFRELAEPVPPDRLTDEEFGTWSALLVEAWRMLCHRHASTARAMSAGLASVNPLSPGADPGGRSASTGEAFGALLMSRPADPRTLAVTLVHEFAHIQLGGLLHLIDLTDGSDEATFYAPWRDDPRPLAGLLQGIYAFTAIAGFWHEELTAGQGSDIVASFEYALARGQVTQAVEAVAGSGMLTAEGTELIASIRRRVDAWEPLSVPAARLALDAHRAGWRLRHVQPDPAAVRALAEAWPGARPSVRTASTTVVVAGGTNQWSRSRLALIRSRVTAAALGRAHPPGRNGADRAELALITGDLETARSGFQARIIADAGDLDAWTGLALTLSGPARTALIEHPALVRAVHLAQERSTEPAGLARWIGDQQRVIHSPRS